MLRLDYHHQSVSTWRIVLLSRPKMSPRRSYTHSPSRLFLHSFNVRFVLSPRNPAEVNPIEGVYSSKPLASSFPGVQGGLFLAGNERLAEVTSIGSGVKGLKKGDRVCYEGEPCRDLEERCKLA